MSGRVPLGFESLRRILGYLGIGSRDRQDWMMEQDEGLEMMKAARNRGK